MIVKTLDCWPPRTYYLNAILKNKILGVSCIVYDKKISFKETTLESMKSFTMKTANRFDGLREESCHPSHIENTNLEITQLKVSSFILFIDYISVKYNVSNVKCSDLFDEYHWYKNLRTWMLLSLFSTSKRI